MSLILRAVSAKGLITQISWYNIAIKQITLHINDCFLCSLLMILSESIRFSLDFRFEEGNRHEIFAAIYQIIYGCHKTLPTKHINWILIADNEKKPFPLLFSLMTVPQHYDKIKITISTNPANVDKISFQ